MTKIQLPLLDCDANTKTLMPLNFHTRACAANVASEKLIFCGETIHQMLTENNRWKSNKYTWRFASLTVKVLFLPPTL